VKLLDWNQNFVRKVIESAKLRKDNSLKIKRDNEDQDDTGNLFKSLTLTDC